MSNNDNYMDNGTGTSCEGVVHGRVGDVGPARSISSEILQKRVALRVASLNVGTMRGRASEVVETLERRRIDICASQETRWKGGSARMIPGKDHRYKFLWTGDDTGFGGVGILVAEKWIDKIISVDRHSSRQMSLRILIGRKMLNVITAYAPQPGLPEVEKDDFFFNLLSSISAVPSGELLIVCGDLNGHVGKTSDGFEGTHGGHGYGVRNPEGSRILELCSAADLVITNTHFTKPDSQLVTFRSGGAQSQIDYILTRKSDRKSVRNVKVIGGEECTTQHKLLVADLEIYSSSLFSKPRVIPPRLKLWKLKEPEVLNLYRNIVCESAQAFEYPKDPDSAWTEIKSCLLAASDSACGWTSGNKPKRKDTWWWNDEVDFAIKEKRRLWKEWQKGGDKEKYLRAKRTAKSTVYSARKHAQEVKYGNLRSKEQRNLIFKEARKMKDENQDIVGDKCIKDDNDNLAFDDKSKLDAWKCHYDKLLNVEFPWDSSTLPVVPPVQGPSIKITTDMVSNALSLMKKGKAAGPSGITVEMILAGGEVIVYAITHLINCVIAEGRIPHDWSRSYIINCFKGKGDALERANYRGLKLLDQVMKVMERVLETIIRTQVDIDAMQFGFMPGRGTTDAIFILRQIHEKYLRKQKDLFFIFVDLEKAFDRVPRKVLWWALRKLGVEEWLIKTVQAMYTNPMSSVRVNSQYSPWFNVQVGVHQGSVLSPLLFVIVMEALSREFYTSCPWELLYADDLVLVAESLQELLERFDIWKTNMESKGLRVNTGKTKILRSAHNAPKPINPSAYPCGVCGKGVGSNSIKCSFCGLWVHKRCTGIKGALRPHDFKCKKCKGENATPTTPAELAPVVIEGETIEVVKSFCYLGDFIGERGGCFDATTARIRSAWKKFRELLPILTCRGISLVTRGHVYSACVRSVMLYASETWPVTRDDITRLERNDMMMIRWICSAKLTDRIPSNELRGRLHLSGVEDMLRWGRLRWFGHLQRMDDETWPKKILDFAIDGRNPRGRPRKSWMDCIRSDMKSLGLKTSMAQNRTEWRCAIRPPSFSLS